MEHIEQIEQSGGNKQTPLIPICKFQSISWVMTWHNYPEDIFEQIEQRLVPLCDIYVFGQELGTSGKSPHIQGAFRLKKKIRQSTIWKLFGTTFYLDKMHGSFDDQVYCIKEGLKYITNYNFPKPLKLLNIESFYNYQNKVIELLNTEPNDRDIFWFYGDFNTGKTQISKYCVAKNLACGPLEGGKRHMLSVVEKNQNENGYLIYLTADESAYQTSEMFNTMEKIKDGFFMSHFGTKSCEPVIMNSPHIIVFANNRPDFKKTEMDKKRFKIYKILEKGGFLDESIDRKKIRKAKPVE